MSQRLLRVVGVGMLILALVWLAAWGGYRWAQSTRMTAERVRDYVADTELAGLSEGERRAALEGLVRRITALPPEERRRVRLERAWEAWFTVMTEEEKGWFIEETLPSGFRQMMASFEQMPEARRLIAVEDATKRLREARDLLAEEGEWSEEDGTNSAPVLSQELRQTVVTLGLRAYYSESSAQAKAELAPLLEEIQRSMESGRLLRRGRFRE
jgi:hypothetical protein